MPLLAAFAAVSALGSPQQETISGVQVSYALVKHDLTVGEPVLLRFEVKNGLTERIFVDGRVNFNGYGGFRVSTTCPDGRTVDAPKPSVHELISGGPTIVGANQSLSAILLLNKWVDFDVPGRYVMRVETVRPLTTESGVRLPYTTEGDVDIDIGPRDPVRLQGIAAGLWKKLANASSFSESISPAEELAHINDPIAVEYLTRALATKADLAPWMARGLERIGDATAVDALISKLNGSTGDTRDVIKSTLRSIERRTSDMALKQKVSEALR
jgi:hypothetical protein